MTILVKPFQVSIQCAVFIFLLSVSSRGFCQDISGPNVVCAGESHVYRVIYVGTSYADWSIISGSGTIVSSSRISAVVVWNSGPGTLKCNYTYSTGDGDNLYNSTIKVVVNQSSGACSGSDNKNYYISGPTSVCNGTTKAYYSQPPSINEGYGSITWSTMLGNAIVNKSPSDPYQANVTWSTPGTLKFAGTVYDEDGPMWTDIYTLPVTINTPVTPTFTTGPTSVCKGETQTYTTQSGMGNYIWTVSSGGTIISGGTTISNSATIQWNGGGPQSISVSYANGACTPVSVTRNVSVSSLSVLSGNATISAGQSANLAVNITGGTSPYSFTIDNGIGLKSNYTSGSPIPVSPPSTTIYSIVGLVTDAAGCSAEAKGNAKITIPVNFQDILNNKVYQYKYDARKRVIQKKVPGADWVYFVYDDRDRIVMTQDGVQRTNKQWSYIQYDVLNRPVITGIYTHTVVLDQAGMSALISTSNFYETFNEEEGPYGYSNTVFSSSSFNQTAFNPLTVMYYDGYSFTNLFTGDYSYKSSELSGMATRLTNVNDYVTGIKTKIVGSNSWLNSVNYFDDKYQLIQSIRDNNKGGKNTISNTFDFVGRIKKSKTSHTNSTGQINIAEHTFEYDHAGRLIKTWHSINGASPILLSQNEYNEIGQLVDKKLHSIDNGNNFIQSIDYRYNIRGWLTSVNNSQLSADGNLNDNNNDLFGMELSYNQPFVGINDQANDKLNFNGNVSAVKWSANQGLDAIKERTYSYRYDPLNRITSATFKVKKENWALPSIKDENNNSVTVSAFSEMDYDYDLNGNIKALTRKAKDGTNMDALTYTYGGDTTPGNQLLKVSDAGDKMHGFVDGNNTDNDYVYDANGNMIADKNKGISAITYSYLNLPEQITKTTGDYIKYTYDAVGTKLSQQVFSPSGVVIKRTDYAGEFYYENDILQFIAHEEGRIGMTGSQPEYLYDLKDHLGSVRLSFTTKPDTDKGTATVEASNESAEREKFLRYDNVRLVNSSLFDHTNNSNGLPSGNAVRLSGGINEKEGLARSLSVMPGDVINMEVFAKYIDPNANTNNFLPVLSSFLTNLAASAPGTVIDGVGYSTSTATFPTLYTGLLDKSGSTGGPKAYLNYLVFDRDFNFLVGQSGYKRLSAIPKEDGSNVSHEAINSSITITQPGYVYIYLSNEEASPVEVYFDDFMVEQIKSPVIQSNDYYPFGLSFNEFTRENSLYNKFQYNGKERQDDLGLGWMDYGARMYMGDIGRWGVIDPMAETMPDQSNYNYVYNNPIAFTDPTGMEPDDEIGDHIGTVINFSGSASGGPNKNGVSTATGLSLDWLKDPESETGSYDLGSSIDLGGNDPVQTQGGPGDGNPFNGFLDRMKSWVSQFMSNGQDDLYTGKSSYNLRQTNNVVTAISRSTQITPYVSASFGKYGGLLSDNYTLTMTPNGMYVTAGMDFTIDSGGGLPNLGGSFGFMIGPKDGMIGPGWGATGGAGYVGFETGGSLNYTPNITLGRPSSVGFAVSTSQYWGGISGGYTFQVYNFKK